MDAALALAVASKYTPHKTHGILIASMEHYKDLQSKPFFPKLIDYITSGPVVCMAWEGARRCCCISTQVNWGNKSSECRARHNQREILLFKLEGINVIHGSDSPENGKREIALWFKEGELSQWTPVQEPWLKE